VILLLAVTRAVFGLRVLGRPVDVAGGLLLGAAAFFAIGGVLGARIRSVRTAQAVTMALFLPMSMLSACTSRAS